MTITDEDMYIAAVTLASCVTQSQLDIGNAYPPLSTIREVRQDKTYYVCLPYPILIWPALSFMTNCSCCIPICLSVWLGLQYRMFTVTQYTHHPPILYGLLITTHSSQVSAKIAAAVATNVFATGRSAGGGEAPKDILAACKAAMYFPKYWTHPPPMPLPPPPHSAHRQRDCINVLEHQSRPWPKHRQNLTLSFPPYPWLLRRETSPTYYILDRQIPDLLRFVHFPSPLHVPNHSTPSACPS